MVPFHHEFESCLLYSFSDKGFLSKFPCELRISRSKNLQASPLYSCLLVSKSKARVFWFKNQRNVSWLRRWKRKECCENLQRVCLWTASHLLELAKVLPMLLLLSRANLHPFIEQEKKFLSFHGFFLFQILFSQEEKNKKSAYGQASTKRGSS